MKDFYSISEPYIKDRNEYRKCKRETVLNTIKPICDAFGIKDYDVSPTKKLYVCNKGVLK